MTADVLELVRADAALRLYYAAALRWVNAERTAHGARAILRLPKGHRTSPGACPVSGGVGHGLIVDGDRGYYPGGDYPGNDPDGFELPGEVAEFVARFDRGDYPHLVAS